MGLFPPLRPHFDAALRDVTSAKPSSRGLAVASLSDPPEGRRDEALEALRPLLDDPHPEVRAGALSGVARLGDEGSLEAIVARFDDGDPTVRQVALIAAGELGHADALPALRRALRDDEAATRFQAIASIAALDPEEAAPALTPLADDADREVRQQLSDVLSTLEDPRARSALTSLLADEAREIRWSAAVGLARLGDRSGTQALIDALSDRDRCFEAAWALAELGARDGIEPLAQLANSFLSPLACKAAAAAALVRLDDPRGVPALRGVLTALRWEARSYAVELVGELEEIELAPELIALSKRPRGADLVVVAKSLAALAPRSEAATEALRELSRQSSEAGEAARRLLEERA